MNMKEIEDLIAISRKYGADSRYVIAGGGNTSYKNADRIWVKASGHALATIDEDGFAVLDRAVLNTMGTKEYSADTAEREAEVKKDLAIACVTSGRRPSVETSLHNCMNLSYVVHLHPTLVNGLMCSNNAEAACKEMFPDALYIEYTDPGYTLFKKVYDRIEAYKGAHGKEPQVIFLQNHGIFVGANSTAEIEKIYDGIFAKLSEKVSAPDETKADIPDSVSEIVPVIRQILSRKGRGLKTVKVLRSALTEKFLSSPEAFSKVSVPFTPDMIVYCKSEYVYVGADSAEEILKQAEEKIEAFVAKHGFTPKIIAVKGLGLLSVGDNNKGAQIAEDVFVDAMKIASYSESFGGPHAMEQAWSDFIDNWEVENYRRKVASTASKGRVEGKTIIVTGAAQGFGQGIAKELLQEGANIVVADLNDVTGNATVDEFNKLAKSNKAIFVKTNVSDLDSLHGLIKETIVNFGALDVFISNAGVVRAGNLEQLEPKDFDFVTKINYYGFFYCSKVASHVMKLETAADPEYFADIIQVNSKSGLVGSKANYAYAGSKFGGIGLIQSFALELAPFRVKVNGICPGNFLDGPLWSDPVKGLFIQYLNAGKVPGAKNVEDVREYYLSKVPMHKGCNPTDVAKAILYAIDQTGETGQAIPVTGGQVMLA
jgi:NAD(P)-dependent dehydrogenase (short-subunit alcohol dehydrogenase family)/rhamnose utilization protein RhaD (predicted bifunctional aldolase and dehydrogenase)